MRVLISTTAGQGHFGPLLPFARALREAGHEVLVTAPRSFGPVVTGAGLPHWPCADMDRGLLQPLPANDSGAERRRAGQVFAELGPRAMLPGVLAAMDEWQPDLVLREVAEIGSLVAARLRALPHAQVLYGLSGTIDKVAAASPLIAQWAGEHGLRGDQLREALARTPSLSMVPAPYDVVPQARHAAIHRYRAVPPRDVQGLPDWWPGNADPLVYVTFGTEAHHFPFARTALRQTVEALASLPARLLVTVGEQGETDGWPAGHGNVRVERWVAQRDAMAAASVVVSHAGSGTVLGALESGLPQVTVPLFADQHDNAARLAALGLGLAVKAGHDGDIDQAELRGAVRQVLNEGSFRDRSRAMALDAAALPRLEEAVALLEEIAAHSA